ncbi:hypothetical protein [Candidatus Contubernalis alkaliaceticus]|uniref:hypothetical protein n=1 Tax=Candidatus Contubernalis alkaliaceticus TaxID=338645 RepID=UPI001F4BDFD4|nr:hypothetical protein [Candidatus Contubernalis alkalaceticus]UNC93266.1 hypothetical protein HUE98_14920 [Candidatus Contubernalis alkalaceticus]
MNNSFSFAGFVFQLLNFFIIVGFIYGIIFIIRINSRIKMVEEKIMQLEAKSKK